MTDMAVLIKTLELTMMQGEGPSRNAYPLNVSTGPCAASEVLMPEVPTVRAAAESRGEGPDNEGSFEREPLTKPPSPKIGTSEEDPISPQITFFFPASMETSSFAHFATKSPTQSLAIDATTIDATTLFKLGTTTPEEAVATGPSTMTALSIARSVLSDSSAVKRLYLDHPDMLTPTVLHFGAVQDPTDEQRAAGITENIPVPICGENVVSRPGHNDLFTVPISSGRPVAVCRPKQWNTVQTLFPSATCATPPTLRKQMMLGSRGASAVFDIFVVPTGSTEEEAAMRHELRANGVTETGLYFRCIHKASGEPQTNKSFIILRGGVDKTKIFIEIPYDASETRWMRLRHGDILSVAKSAIVFVKAPAFGKRKREKIPEVDVEGMNAMTSDAIRQLLFAPTTEGKEDEEAGPIRSREAMPPATVCAEEMYDDGSIILLSESNDESEDEASLSTW